MKKIAFLFPGQGTQFVGMGKFFFDNYAIARQTFQEISNISEVDIREVVFNGKVSKLNEFINMQLTILAVEVSIFRVFMMEYGISPQFIIGHSIGEYSALVCSGAITLQDAVRIVMKRGELVQRIINLQIGYMTIVEECSAEVIENCIQKAQAMNHVYISCYNSNRQSAISGYNESMGKVEELLDNEGAKCTPLIFSPPIHSKIMNEISKEFFDYVSSFEFHDFRFSLISNYTGEFFSDKSRIAELLTNQLCHPVKFTAVKKKMYDFGVNMTIEMSPKSLLSEFVKNDYPDVETLCAGIKNDRIILEELFDKKEYRYSSSTLFIGKCISIIAITKNRNENTEEYREVIKINNWMREEYISSLSKKKELGKEDRDRYVSELVKALKIKKVEKVHIDEFIRELPDETNIYYEIEE